MQEDGKMFTEYAEILSAWEKLQNILQQEMKGHLERETLQLSNGAHWQKLAG